MDCEGRGLEQEYPKRQEGKGRKRKGVSLGGGKGDSHDQNWTDATRRAGIRDAGRKLDEEEKEEVTREKMSEDVQAGGP